MMRATPNQQTPCTCHWEQDGAGGEHGMATFFPNNDYAISVRMENFKAAHSLLTAIERRMSDVRESSRAGLFAEINRLKP